MHMTETIKAFEFPDGSFLFETPILGAIRDCEITDDGWRGVMPDGSRIEMRDPDPSRKVKLPKHHILAQSGKGLATVFGAYLIKKRRRRRTAE
jgi:hypothetical protein